MKKIVALTGCRSEYDILFPLLKKIDDTDDFNLELVVTGAHLTPLHNYSIKNIEEDGFKIVARIEHLIYSNSSSAKVVSIGSMIQQLSMVLAASNPDMLVVLGDREEVLAGAMSASYMNIPVVHIAGGDNTYPVGGDVDEQVRHATSKLSHIHLTMTEAHSERLIKMGEEAWRVYTVGNAGLDKIRMTPHLSLMDLEGYLSIPIEKDFCVFIYHPLSSYSKGQIELEIRNALRACLALDLQVFIGAPNSDPGFEWIMQIYDEYSSNPKFIFYKNIPRDFFVNLLRYAKCIVGNSSLGILEAGYLHIPVVNIGERQKGRLSDINVQFVSHDFDQIINALTHAVQNAKFRQEIDCIESIYGAGYMAEKSIDILRNLPGKKTLLYKVNAY